MAVLAEAKVESIVPLKTDNKDLLSQFYNLSSFDESVRIQSIINIINILKTTEKKVDLDYTVGRLVKGLGSSRKAARQGNATALTHLIREFNQVTTDDIFKLMSDNLAVTGAVKGQDERDHYFGQVFGFLSICKSKLKEGMDVVVIRTVIENLLKLTKKKSYLQEICGKGICDIIKMVDYDVFNEHVLKVLEPSLTCGWSSCTPEDLLVVLTVEKLFKNQLPEKYFCEHWHQIDILHHDNFTNLSKILIETTNTSHPRVHILWDVVLEEILHKSNEKYFEKFWKTTVEDCLLQSTHERKFLAVNILLKVSSKISSDQVGVVFSKGLLRCIINSCQSKENYLYNAVKDMLKKLPGIVSENTDKNVLLSVVKSLVGSNGHVSFDAMTHSKTVDELSSKINDDTNAYYLWLQDTFKTGSTSNEPQENVPSEKDVSLCRAWVFNQLHSIPSPPLSDISHHQCQQRFLSVLNEVTHFHLQQEQKSPKQTLGGLASDGEFFALKVLQYSKKLLLMPKYVQLKDTWTPEVFDSFNNGMEIIDSMIDDETGSLTKTKGTQLLFIHTTLQLFSSREEAVDILQELHTCYTKAEEKKKRKKTEPHWTEVLTEILLGFLAQPSHLLRQVVDMVFPTIAPHLTPEAFNLLINSIKPKSKNEDDGFDVEHDSDEEIPDQENNDVDIKNDLNNSEKVNGDTGDKDDEEADSEDEESSESESDESDMEVDETFKAELKAALGDAAVNSDDDDENQSDDIDMDTCDPKQLDAMDQAIVSVLISRKQKQTQKKTKKDMKQTILHFKLRVLDLIEIYIKKQPKDPKILHLLEPLLEVIKSTYGHADELALFERTLGIYKNKLCHLHEYPSGVDLDVNQVHLQIEELVQLAKTASSALFVSYITQGIVYLIRVLRGNPELKGPSPLKTRSQRKTRKEATITPAVAVEHTGCLDEKRLTASFTEAMTEFMTKRSSHLQPSLFIEIIQRFPEIGWIMANHLPQYLNNGCNNFRKVKACEMLKLLFSKKTDQFSRCLNELTPLLLEHLSKSFESTKEDSFSLKARQFHDVVHLADIFLKEAVKDEKLATTLDKDILRTSLTAALDSPVISRSPSLLSYCQKFIKSLDELENVDNKSKKKKKK